MFDHFVSSGFEGYSHSKNLNPQSNVRNFNKIHTYKFPTYPRIDITPTSTNSRTHTKFPEILKIILLTENFIFNFCFCNVQLGAPLISIIC